MLALRDRLFNEILNSIFHNATNLGTGVILILAGQAMQAGTFTVGDFALFVYYLEFLSDMTAFSGLLIARYRQIGISVERMQRLMEGAPPDALVEFSPVYLNGKYPAVDVPGKRVKRIILHRLEAANLSYHFPGSENGIQDVNLTLRARLVHRGHRARLARARPPCCACCWACCPRMKARFTGMARRSRNPASSSPRPTAPTPRRCRACSAIRCAITS